MNKKPYIPPKKYLERYADILVNFALNSGKGVKKGEVVHLTGGEITKPLFLATRNAILDAGGHVLSNYIPDDDEAHNPSKDFYLKADGHQLQFFPEKYMKGLIDTIDHSVYLIAETNKEALKGVDPKKIMQRGLAMKQFMDWRRTKENKGKFTWTLALYGTSQMSKQVGMSEKAYWGQIIKACYLDEKNPVAKWREIGEGLENHRKKISKITEQTEKFHIEGVDVDLWITPGDKRKWLSGRGANIPSFEVFTSPDWRGTQGWIRFNQPLYRYGNIIDGIELWFEKGKVVKSKAKRGEKLLKQMIATEGANKVGEFSLTDKRFSRITKPMGETLYDENMGGAQGNTHIALGMSYEDAYAGDVSKLTKKQSEKLGFNDSSVHTDIISTTRRTVTAHLKSGKEVVVYANGQFLLD